MSFRTVPAATVHSAQGRDVSNHNGVQSVTSWGGYQFGFAKATESTNFIDTTFGAQWANMQKAKIHRGAYHFFHPAVDPVKQAQIFVNTVKSHGLVAGDMLVADVEILSGGVLTRLANRLTGNRARNDLVQKPLSLPLVDLSAKRFLDEVKTLVGDRNPILVYTDLSVGKELTSCTGYPLWIAFPSSSAPANVSPWKGWTFWQWGQTGIDRDAYNGTATDLTNWINKFANPAPPSSGMHRHVLTADTSVKAIADSRNLSVHGFYSRQVTMSDADAQKTVYKAGSVYLTTNP